MTKLKIKKDPKHNYCTMSGKLRTSWNQQYRPKADLFSNWVKNIETFILLCKGFSSSFLNLKHLHQILWLQIPIMVKCVQNQGDSVWSEKGTINKALISTPGLMDD